MTTLPHRTPVEDDAEIHGVALVKGLVVGVLVGIPLAIVAITIGLWIFGDMDLVTSIETGIWPAILVGVFFGGFAGMVAAES